MVAVGEGVVDVGVVVVVEGEVPVSAPLSPLAPQPYQYPMREVAYVLSNPIPCVRICNTGSPPLLLPLGIQYCIEILYSPSTVLYPLNAFSVPLPPCFAADNENAAASKLVRGVLILSKTPLREVTGISTVVLRQVLAVAAVAWRAARRARLGSNILLGFW